MSPTSSAARQMYASKKKVASAMREVFSHTPSTVRRVKGKKKLSMLRAIAFAKARKGR